MNRILAIGLFAVTLSGLGCTPADSAETVASADPLTAAADESAPARNAAGEGTPEEARVGEFTKLVYEVRLRLPRGASQWMARLDPPQTSNPLKIVYVPESSCPRSPGINFYVHDALGWHASTISEGLDHLSVSSYDAVRFDFAQNLFRETTCTFRVFGQQGTAPTAGVFAGTFDYRGGFAQNLELPVTTSARIKAFRVALPSFCREVDLLTAGTVTQGIYDEASLVDENAGMFNVAGGSPTRIGAVRVTFNGPSNATCHVPVYVYPTESL